MPVVDACVFISMFNKNDPNHNKAIKILEQIVDRKLKAIIPALTLPEICGAVARSLNKKIAKEIRGKIENWIESGLIRVEELTKNRAKNAAEIAIKLGLKGSDAVYVALAKEFNTQLLTFDEEIKRKSRISF